MIICGHGVIILVSLVSCTALDDVGRYMILVLLGIINSIKIRFVTDRYAPCGIILCYEQYEHFGPFKVNRERYSKNFYINV